MSALESPAGRTRSPADHVPREEREQEVLDRIERFRARRPKFTDPRITMSHGAGGKATRALVEGLLVPALAPRATEPVRNTGGDKLRPYSPGLRAGTHAREAREGNPTQVPAGALEAPLELLDDAARFEIGGAGLALTTDTFVVKPIRFPGGSIGELAVNGTVNDLAVAGARPLAITLSLVLEEGLESEVLRAEVEAVARAAEAAGVKVVAGDTKVVERGHADQMYVCTTGIGRTDPRARLSPRSLRPGDRILLSGRVGDHGTAIMLARGELGLAAEVASDTRSLWPAADALLQVAGSAAGSAAGSTPGGGLRAMRDATRGGVASVLNELAQASGVSMLVREAAVPVAPEVAGACEILGIDPMYVANEGKLVACVAPEAADEALAALRRVPGCEEAAEVGVVAEEAPGLVLVETGFGGRRVMDLLAGDPLPRIC